jgi:hypothetical protein
MKRDLNDENFITEMLVASINLMATNSYSWPTKWTDADKQHFLETCLTYTIEHELYEQSAILRDVEKTIKTK